MKIGRNDPCRCGSGKKYKKCHLAQDAAASPRAASVPISGAEIARRIADTFLVSDGASDETLAIAERYFADKDAGRSPAQQMMEFAQPLLEATGGTPDEIDKALALAMLFWNLALKPKEEREEAVANSLLKDADAEVRATFQEMATSMIARHETMFPELHAK